MSGAPVKVIFGADWCPHTQNAVSALGGHYEVRGGAFSTSNPAKRVRYVNCAAKQNAGLCQSQKIDGYPTFMNCQGSTCTPASASSFGINPSQLQVLVR